MGYTNLESSVRTIKLGMKEGYNGISAQVSKINTGSYRYTINAKYDTTRGLYFIIAKEKVGKTYKFIGAIDIIKYSQYGIEYDNSIIGSIPDSVSKSIIKFVKAIQSYEQDNFIKFENIRKTIQKYYPWEVHSLNYNDGAAGYKIDGTIYFACDIELNDCNTYTLVEVWVDFNKKTIEIELEEDSGSKYITKAKSFNEKGIKDMIELFLKKVSSKL